MIRYSFKIQYCAEGSKLAELIEEFSFKAPNKELANQLAEDIYNSYTIVMTDHMQKVRRYERTAVVEG